MTPKKTIEKPLGDTEYMLEQWGIWRTSGTGIPRYISPMYAVMRDNAPQPGRSYQISDDLAMLIDGIVARLCKREEGRTKGPLMGDCVWLYFGMKWPALRVGRHYGVSERTARETIKAGVAWIDSALEIVRTAA